MDKPELEFSNVSEVEPSESVEQKPEPQSSGSFTKTMVIYVAIALFTVWLLGQGVLWLIGGVPSGASQHADAASDDTSEPAVANLMPQDGSSTDEKAEASAVENNIKTSGSEKQSHFKTKRSGDRKSEMGGLEAESDDQKTKAPAARSKPPTETSVRTYKKSTPKKSAETSRSSTRDRGARDSNRGANVSKTGRGASKTYPMRVWTSSLGNEATLALVGVEDGKVVVVDEKGTEFSLPFSRFSDEDQDYVREAVEE